MESRQNEDARLDMALTIGEWKAATFAARPWTAPKKAAKPMDDTV